MELSLVKFRGYCSKCGEPFGYVDLKEREIFCYNCEDYEVLDLSKCLQYCNEKLETLRISFRKLIIEGNAYRYLRNFLNVLETLFISDENEISVAIPIERKIELLKWNPHLFITITIGIRWIIEDLNYKTSNTHLFLKGEDTKILSQWYKLFQQKVFLENELGIFIKDKDQNIKFYYYQLLDFYQDSLNDFSTFKEGGITPENYDDIVTEIFEKRLNPKNAIELVKYDFPLTYICLLYNFYPNKNDRMFSFEDILADHSVPVILKKIINIYDEKRALSQEELNNKNFFAVTTIEQLKSDLKKIPWSFEIFYYIFIASQKNPMSFPLLIEYGNEIYISPTRLKIALRLMNQKLIHNYMSSDLSKIFEREFQDIVIKILKKKIINVEDPITKIELINIMDKKKNSFEFDILAYDNDNLYIIECKSFHPHPFYQLKENRGRRKEYLIRFDSQFGNRIRPWLIDKLKKEPINDFIEIECVQRNISNNKLHSTIIYLPDKFHNIKRNNIKALYITQINENFPLKSEVHQIYFKDLEIFEGDLI